MSVKHQIARKDITDAGLTILSLDYVVGTGSNISVRIPGEELIAITPTGIAFDKMTPEMVAIIDMEGNLIDGEFEPSKALQMHLSIYKERDDVNAIIHTHPTYCTALALARKPIPAAWEDMIESVGGCVNVADYVLPNASQIGPIVCEALADKLAVLLANNGLVTVGEHLKCAITVAEICEKSAHSVLLAHMVGGPVPLPEADCQVLKQFYNNKICKL
jgi:L-fuculose-phosphate aldolase